MLLRACKWSDEEKDFRRGFLELWRNKVSSAPGASNGSSRPKRKLSTFRNSQLFIEFPVIFTIFLCSNIKFFIGKFISLQTLLTLRLWCWGRMLHSPHLSYSPAFGMRQRLKCHKGMHPSGNMKNTQIGLRDISSLPLIKDVFLCENSL